MYNGSISIHLFSIGNSGRLGRIKQCIIHKASGFINCYSNCIVPKTQKLKTKHLGQHMCIHMHTKYEDDLDDELHNKESRIKLTSP
jgi:hypothetical protein